MRWRVPELACKGKGAYRQISDYLSSTYTCQIHNGHDFIEMEDRKTIWKSRWKFLMSASVLVHRRVHVRSMP